MKIPLNEVQEKLENFIDEHGLNIIIEQITEICYLKADHVKSNWQDDHLAENWELQGDEIRDINFYI